MVQQAIRIKTDPDPYEAFCLAQAYRVDNMIYVSGQAAFSLEGKVVGAGDFDAQAVQVFENLQTVLQAGGSDLSKVIKVTIFLKDMGNFSKIIALRKKYFTPPYPADTIVEITGLALPELEIEIEAMAFVDGEIIG
ncbi:MAG: RidA family protein [Proteobacteria bacterium]|nr:RidA family protein [Pseudomonadota bacterium]MDA1354986.1 RidA family protein [Pseudomonadota bacterium]